MANKNFPYGQARYTRILKRRTIVWICLFGLAVYLVAAGFAGLRLSLQAVRSADISLLLAASFAVALSYVAAACTYVLLATKPIAFFPTLLIEVSGGLVNRLLPGGLGGLGINVLYLKKQGYSLPAATAVVTTNNILGFIGNALLFIGVSSIYRLPISKLQFPDIPIGFLTIGCAAILLLVICILKRSKTRQSLFHGLSEAGKYLCVLSQRPIRVVLALLSSCSLTVFHASALYVVLMAIHAETIWPVALLAVSAGAFTGAAVPTPGGIGAAEAGITAALLAFSVTSPSAVAAALIYRGLTYWLPLLPGYLALRVAEKNYL